MKQITGKWTMALLLGFCIAFSISMKAEAETVSYNTVYRIVDMNSKKPIDIEDGSQENGAAAQIWDWKNDHANQMFYFEKSGDYVKIKALHSLKVLMVRKSSFKDSAVVYQWADEGLSSMEWKVIDNGDGTVSFENHNSGKRLDVAGGGKSKGTTLQQYRADGSDSQKFRLDEVTADEIGQAMLSSDRYLKPELEKLYRIVNTESGKVFDIRDSSKENGAVVQLWSEREGQRNQMFRFRSRGKGFYSIHVNHSKKALEVGGASKELSAGINQWTHIEDYPTQMWKLIALDNDNFILCNKNSGLVADVYSGDLSNGQLVTQYSFNGSKAQIFHLEVVDRDEYE